MGAKKGMTWRGHAPDGFRAVRVRGNTEVVFCADRAAIAKKYGLNKQEVIADYQVRALDGTQIGVFTKSEFNAQFVSEYVPMPPAIKALFNDRPSFAEWWDKHNQKEKTP